MASSIESAVVRLGVRAGRAELLDVLRSCALDCAVGPAEPGGWVAVDFPEDVDHARLAGELSAVLDTPVVVCSSDEKRAAVRVWRGGRDLGGYATDVDADRRIVARRLATALDRGDVEADLTTLLGSEFRATGIHAVIALLGLPRWLVDPPTPAYAVVCYQDQRTAAGPFVGLAGPAWRAPAERDWFLLVPTQPDVQRVARLTGVLSAVVRRRVALTLWRHGDQFGYLLCRRGRPIDSQVWNSPWEILGDDAQPEDGNAALLAEQTGQSDNAMLVRAMLRRGGNPHELIAELTQVLRLPDAIPDLLDGRCAPDQLPGVRWVEPVSMTGALLRPSHGMVRAVLVAAVAAAAVFAVLTVVGVLVLASNGAFVDQAGVSAEDIGGTIVLGALTAAAVGIALVCRRHLRR